MVVDRRERRVALDVAAARDVRALARVDVEAPADPHAFVAPRGAAVVDGDADLVVLHVVQIEDAVGHRRVGVPSDRADADREVRDVSEADRRAVEPRDANTDVVSRPAMRSLDEARNVHGEVEPRRGAVAHADDWPRVQSGPVDRRPRALDVADPRIERRADLVSRAGAEEQPTR